MANIKYFYDANGETFELTHIRHIGPGTSKAKFFAGRLPSGEVVPATRMIERKNNASMHECDARCMNATGKIMRCECACGGKNHGRGMIQCEAA